MPVHLANRYEPASIRLMKERARRLDEAFQLTANHLGLTMLNTMQRGEETEPLAKIDADIAVRPGVYIRGFELAARYLGTLPHNYPGDVTPEDSRAFGLYSRPEMELTMRSIGDITDVGFWKPYSISLTGSVRDLAPTVPADFADCPVPVGLVVAAAVDLRQEYMHIHQPELLG